VSASFVQSYLNGESAIGRTFEFGPAGLRSIVGVVGDVRVRGLERRSEPQVYLPFTQQGDNQTMGYTPKDLVVRFDASHGDDDAMQAAVPRFVRCSPPPIPISDYGHSAAVRDHRGRDRDAHGAGSCAWRVCVPSCVLAAVGLHGLLAFVVSARTREFGVRLALGARPRQILVAVAGGEFCLVGLACAVGLLVAYDAAAWLDSLLAGI
jgi:hypothetical protein